MRDAIGNFANRKKNEKGGEWKKPPLCGIKKKTVRVEMSPGDPLVSDKVRNSQGF